MNMASVFGSSGIATGFAAVSILAVVGSTPATAQLSWDLSTAPIKYLQYLPYYKLPLVPFTKYMHPRLGQRLAVGRYEGLYNYAPNSVENGPMVGAGAHQKRFGA
jgi:hypothetical protein